MPPPIDTQTAAALESTYTDLAVRRVRVANADTVWLRSILEAYDGLVQWTGDGSGVLTLRVPRAQLADLDGLLADLAREAALQVLDAH